MASRILYCAFFLLTFQLTQVSCRQYSENGEGLSITEATVRFPTGNPFLEILAQKGGYRNEGYSGYNNHHAMKTAAIAYIIMIVFSVMSCCVGICCFCSKGRRKVTAGYVISDPNQGTTSAPAEPQQHFPEKPPAYNTPEVQQYQTCV